MFIVQTKSLKGARPTNEDELDIFMNYDESILDKNKVNLYGVYDGHGGSDISEYIKPKLCKYFTDKVCNFTVAKTTKCNKVIKHIYELLQDKIKQNIPSANVSGSTALVIIHYSKNNIFSQLKIINLGDCRAVLCKNNNLAVQLTKDHKPMELDEYQRITKMGGTIEIASYNIPRIMGLSVSKAFGDLECTPYVSHEPEIFDYELEIINNNINDKFLILACDGVWDVLSCQDAVTFVLFRLSEISELNSCDNFGKNNIALALGKHAIEKGSEDNISVSIIFFQ